MEIKRGHKCEHGCLMVFLGFEPNRWRELQDSINEEDLYTEEHDDGYGLEKDSHVTILDGLDKYIQDEDIEKDIENITSPDIKIKNISVFEKEEYDILKFDVYSKDLFKLNKIFMKYPHTAKFPTYHPHITIAYLKKGRGQEYVNKLKDFVNMKVVPLKIVYSKADGTEEEYEIK